MDLLEEGKNDILFLTAKGAVKLEHLRNMPREDTGKEELL